MLRGMDVVNDELAMASFRLPGLYQCLPGETEKDHEIYAFCVSTLKPGIEQVPPPPDIKTGLYPSTAVFNCLAGYYFRFQFGVYGFQSRQGYSSDEFGSCIGLCWSCFLVSSRRFLICIAYIASNEGMLMNEYY
jgi:hypothetical protein